MAVLTTYELPHGIKIKVWPNGSAHLKSDLKKELVDDTDDKLTQAKAEGAVDAIEALLLNLASAGVDVSAPAFAQALGETLVSVADNLA